MGMFQSSDLKSERDPRPSTTPPHLNSLNEGAVPWAPGGKCRSDSPAETVPWRTTVAAPAGQERFTRSANDPARSGSRPMSESAIWAGRRHADMLESEHM